MKVLIKHSGHLHRVYLMPWLENLTGSVSSSSSAVPLHLLVATNYKSMMPLVKVSIMPFLNLYACKEITHNYRIAHQ